MKKKPDKNVVKKKIRRLIEKITSEALIIYAVDITKNLKDIQEVHKLISSINHFQFNISEISDIFFYSMMDHISKIKIEFQKPTTLKNVLSSEEYDGINELIFHLIVNAPHNYDIYIYFPLLNFNNSKIVKLADEVSLVRFSTENEKPKAIQFNPYSEADTNPFQSSGSYLKVKVKGFAFNSLENSAIQESITILKLFLEFGFAWNIIKYDRIYSLLNPSYSISPPNILSVINFKGRSICFSLHLNEFLYRNISIIVFNNSTIDKIIEKLDLRKKLKSEFVENEAIKKAFLQLYILFQKKESNPTTNAIINALEWSNEARFSHSKTVSFINICLGLEAILGFESPKQNKTFTLSDRCAYILAEITSERNLIRKKFENLYNIRSDIIHGKKVRLNNEEIQLYRWGEAILSQLIQKEIQKL